MIKRLLLVGVLGVLGCKNSDSMVDGEDLRPVSTTDLRPVGDDLSVASSDMAVAAGDDLLAAASDLLATPDLFVVEYDVVVSKAAANLLDNLSVNGVSSTDTIVTKTFIAGTAVTIEAQPGTNRAFVAWSGGPCDASTNPVCSIASLSADVSMLATFANTYALTLTITTPATGDKIVVDSVEYTSSAVVRLVEGTGHSSSILPGEHRSFDTASYCPLGSIDSFGSAGSCTFKVNSDVSLSVTFKPQPVYIAANLVFNGGGMGTVTSNPAGIACSVIGAPLLDCTGLFPYGELAVLTAVPDGSSNLTSWSGCDSNPTPATCNVFPMSSFTQITVTFESK